MDSDTQRHQGSGRMLLIVGVFALTILSPTDGSSKPVPKVTAPTSPPRGYMMIIPCHPQLGQVWAPPSASEHSGGNEPPMLGFFQGQLVGMVFHLSEKHLYASFPGGARWGFSGYVNTTVDSISVAPAQLRPNRDKRAYELVMMVHHDSPIKVTCAATNTPPLNQSSQGGQGQVGGSTPNQGGGGATGPPPGPGGGFGGPLGGGGGGPKRPK